MLSKHLQELPYFRALLRSMEARFYRDALPFDEPVLDLGCGDGHFAAAALSGAARALHAGVDVKGSVLREARRRRAHRIVAQAAGRALPFGRDSFGTVVSNSVLEHIPDVQPVVAEVSRVLRPGGRFLFCVPSDRFGELLLLPRLLPTRGLAAAYERQFRRLCRHYHCDSLETWRSRLEAAGLRLVASAGYLSERGQHAVEIGHYLGLPSLAARRLTGRWILVPRAWNLALTERLLRGYVAEPPPAKAAYWFITAVKDGEGGA